MHYCIDKINGARIPIREAKTYILVTDITYDLELDLKWYKVLGC